VAFVWSFTIFLFTRPFLMLSMCFSLVYIHFYEEETAETLGSLPEYLNCSMARICSSSWVNYIISSKLLPPRVRSG
jgi:hypothetical protein